jgi:hypothetical protein
MSLLPLRIHEAPLLMPRSQEASAEALELHYNPTPQSENSCPQMVNLTVIETPHKWTRAPT